MAIGECMKNSIILTILLSTVLILSGCIGQGYSGTLDDSLAIHLTDISQIDEALLNGPVLLKIGGDCQPCKDQDPIIIELAEEYERNATVMYVDIHESPELIVSFNVHAIPDLCVIVGVENGKYIYMAHDGTTSKHHESTKFIGLTDKQMLVKTLDHAIEEYNNK